MKRAFDFRSEARSGLKNNWIAAVIAGIIASLLGASEVLSKFNFNIQTTDSGSAVSLHAGGMTVFDTQNGILAGITMIVVILALIYAVLYFAVGSFIAVGYAKFNLDIVDHKQAKITDLLSYAGIWKTAVAARLLQTLIVFLLSLLLIIPGVIAAYSFAMTEYVLAEHPELSAREAIRRSREIMAGNRWRFFCLGMSFIGWALLAGLTFGIGNLFLNPYMQAANAAFYRDVSNTGTEAEWF